MRAQLEYDEKRREKHRGASKHGVQCSSAFPCDSLAPSAVAVPLLCSRLTLDFLDELHELFDVTLLRSIASCGVGLRRLFERACSGAEALTLLLHGRAAGAGLASARHGPWSIIAFAVSAAFAVVPVGAHRHTHRGAAVRLLLCAAAEEERGTVHTQAQWGRLSTKRCARQRAIDSMSWILCALLRCVLSRSTAQSQLANARRPHHSNITERG